MMVKIACNSRGHAGIANSSTLPRELQCSRCGDRRYVAPKDCARIRNRIYRLGNGAGDGKDSRSRCPDELFVLAPSCLLVPLRIDLRVADGDDFFIFRM